MAGKPRLVLIASTHEWSSRSLESILGPNGFDVLRVNTRERVLEQARTAQPDLIIIDSTLTSSDGLDVCRALRQDPQLRSSTPILIVSANPPTRQRRIDALRAGAWDHLGQPLDAEELLLRIKALTQAKRDSDRAREEGLIDPDTGFYNMRGLARRAQELGSQAARKHAAFGCIVIAPDVDPDDGTRQADVEHAVRVVADVFKTVGRRSDAIGRLGPTEFAVVAIDASPAGCVKTAERLANAVQSAPTPPPVHAGYYGVSDFHETSVDAVETILRATSALKAARIDPAGGWLRAFGQAST
ncbi:MAG TPA: response regulator [Gemmatimonadales bacterium]|nr:response regulator [Gemmatimonadales bacterium]